MYATWYPYIKEVLFLRMFTNTLPGRGFVSFYDQVYWGFLIDLDVPCLPQDLIDGVDDPSLVLELD